MAMKTNSLVSIRLVVVALAFSLVAIHSLSAQVLYGGGTYQQNFNTLANTPTSTTTTEQTFTWTNNSTLAGWYATRTDTAFEDTYSTSAGVANAPSGGLLSYGPNANSDRALGALGNRAYSWGVRLVNDTGITLTEFTVSYTGETWLQLANTRDIYTSYQIFNSGDGSLTSGTYTGISELTYTSPGGTSTNGFITSSNLSHTVTGINWEHGQELWIRFNNQQVSAASGVAMDDFSFSAIPEPSTYALLGLGLGALVWLRRRQRG